MWRDNWLCQYCGLPADEVDHVHPRSRGGLTEMDNLVAACRSCNRSKGDRTPHEWRHAEAVKQILATRAHRRTRRGQIEAAISRRG